MRAALSQAAQSSGLARKVLVSASVQPATQTSSASSSASVSTNLLQYRRQSSLLFELEDFDVEPTQSMSALEMASSIISSACRGLEPRLGPGHQQLWQDAAAARERLTGGLSSICADVHAFGQALADMGYIVWVRKGTYNCPRGLGIASVKHTFVLIELPTMGAQPVYCVVDPNYKEQFELSGSGSEDYKRLLAALPSVFVGGAEQLSALVHLLCAEMEKVFELRGVALPPWRCPGVMQGRWLVNKAEDEAIQATPSATQDASMTTQAPTLMPAA